MSTPRLLVVVGSGETSPTMTTTHKELFARLGPDPVPAVLLDTPAGFQENVDDLSARTVEYFRTSVGRPVAVASYRSWAAAEADPLAYEKTLARLREARYVFAGPGSPSYALRQWSPSLVPKALADKLATGGCVTFASAAALTLGAFTVPVYEVYKAGEEPRWLDGLDLLAEAGLRVAVVPHYDNAEGGNHDTRYCYLGERRLALMERLLPDGAFVLGVDEHTGCVLDLDAGTTTVVGRGGVTVRRQGRSAAFPAGATVAIEELAARAAAPERARKPRFTPSSSVPPNSSLPPKSALPPNSSLPKELLDVVAGLQEGFDGALATRDVPSAVRAALDLEALLASASVGPPRPNDVEVARAALRSMVVRLGETAEVGARDPADAVAPFVEALLAVRAEARAARRWAEADAVRDRLAAAGVELRDGPEGTSWSLLS